MKIFIKSFALIAIVVGFFISCNNHDAVPNMPHNEYIRLGFNTADGNASKDPSRAVWADPNGSGSLFFNWEAYQGNNSNLLVVISDGVSYLGSYTSGDSVDGEAPKYASMMTVEPVADDNGYSNHANFETVRYYNAEEVKQAKSVHAITPIDEDRLSIVQSEFFLDALLPQEFTQTSHKDPSFLRDFMMMSASAEMNNGTASLKFEHIPATFRFIITNKRETEATIKSVSISRNDAGNVGSGILEISGSSTTTEISKGYTFPYQTITTTISGDDATLAPNESYIAYAMILPLGDEANEFDNNAFYGKKIQFTMATDGEPSNEYLSFSLDANTLANANPAHEYNWVGGKSYTIHINLDGVLNFDGITVSDWIDGGTIEGDTVKQI